MKTSSPARLVAGAFAAALQCASAAAALAQTGSDAGQDAMFRATTLNISAFGEVRAAPDQASISLGVQTLAPTAAQAMSQNADQMTRVIAALKRGGIEAKDIQTSGLSLSAQYAYEQNKPPRLTGYQASNQVAVTVRDLKRLGPALDSVVASGANQINGVSFGLSDPRAAEDEARLKAVQALQAKAQLYAGATGYPLSRLVNLSEGGGYSPPQPRPLAAMAFKVDASSTPVEAGEMSVRVDVSGLYELTR